MGREEPLEKDNETSEIREREREREERRERPDKAVRASFRAGRGDGGTEEAKHITTPK